MREFHFAQITQWLEGKPWGSGKILNFQHNSQEVSTGSLFFALKGEKSDGHQFLCEVAKKGAVGAVISKEYRGERFGLQCVEVDDVLLSLQQLARQVHMTRSTFVIGVTGSVGKTTTKEFIAALLGFKFRVGKTPGNANSQVGVPLSLLNSRGDEEVLVLEMGMSQPGEIRQLVQIAPPDGVVLTQIALAHAAFFPGGLEEIASAKAELFSHPDTKWGVLNQQVLGFRAPCLVGGFKKISYSLASVSKTAKAVLYSDSQEYYIGEGSTRSPQFSLPFNASHLCENFLCAALVAREMGMEWPEIIEQAQHLQPYKNRFELTEKGGVMFVNDSYNASPTSMKAALANLPSPKEGGKRIAVLGAMKELGKFTEEAHFDVGKSAIGKVDHLICLGQECQPMVEVFKEKGIPVELFDDLSEVKIKVRMLAKRGDVVLLKGSNSKQLWRVLEES